MSEADIKRPSDTAVTRIEPNRVVVRGYDIAELMGRASFGAAVYLILDRRIAVACDRTIDGRDFSVVDRSRRDASKRIGCTNNRITGASLSASVRRRHHVRSPGIMAAQSKMCPAIEKDCPIAPRMNPFRWRNLPRARSLP